LFFIFDVIYLPFVSFFFPFWGRFDASEPQKIVQRYYFFLIYASARVLFLKKALFFLPVTFVVCSI